MLAVPSESRIWTRCPSPMLARWANSYGERSKAASFVGCDGKGQLLRAMNIDFHSHYLPANFPQLVCDLAPMYNPQVSDGARGSKLITIKGHDFAPHTVELYDLDEKMLAMERTEIDVQVLSVPPYAQFYWADPEVATSMARTLNDALSQAIQEEPERFMALATAPLQAPAMAAAEMERAVSQLGMRGVVIGASVDGRPLSSPDLRPFFQKVQELGVPVFLHPTNTPMTHLMPDFYLSNLIGYPTETALAAAHLMFGGVLESFPNLNICLAHGGGTLPALLGRMRHGARVRPELRGTTVNSPMDLAKRFYYDSLTHSVRALHFLVDMVGCDRLILGSDFPFDMRDRDPVVAIHSLTGPSLEEIDAMLGRNAAALLGL
jgi:aminocarboxymuconate-semialdehyde decarboxylase